MNRVEEKIFTMTIETLSKAGWELRAVYDGEEMHTATNAAQAKEVAESVDMCFVHFKHTDKGRGWVQYIWGNGNEGLDCQPDCTLNLFPELSAVGDWINHAEGTTLATLINKGYDEDDLEQSNPFNPR